MHRDSLGIEILGTDTVMVTGYGYGARQVDCGVRSPISGYTQTRVRIIDADGCYRLVRPVCLSVLRRDGAQGLEGNVPAHRVQVRMQDQVWDLSPTAAADVADYLTAKYGPPSS